MKLKQIMHSERCFSTAFYGYKSNWDGTLYIDESVVNTIWLIFEMYDSGASVADIAEVLNMRGIKTSRGKEFTIQTIYKILKSEDFYCGYIYSSNGFKHRGSHPRILVPKPQRKSLKH